MTLAASFAVCDSAALSSTELALTSPLHTQPLLLTSVEMGKRNANLSGLARFVSEAFGSTSTTPPQDTPVADSAAEGPSSGTARPVSVAANAPSDDITRPKKKRKVSGLLGPGKEQYDATGLVPFYQEPSQVPSHLQKCEHPLIERDHTLNITMQTSLSANATSRSIPPVVCSTRRAGTASRRSG